MDNKDKITIQDKWKEEYNEYLKKHLKEENDIN